MRLDYLTETLEVLFLWRKRRKKCQRRKKKKKKELTRIITAKITIVENITEHEKVSNNDMADMLKKKLGADNVTVSKVKDFVLEK